MNADLELVLAKSMQTPGGQLKAAFVAGDLAKIAPLFANPGTRVHAEAVLERWAQSPDPLRKGMATAWLAAARNAVTATGQGVGRAASAVGRGASAVNDMASKTSDAVEHAYQRVENKGAALGAIAGKKLFGGSSRVRRVSGAIGRGAVQIGAGTAASAGAAAAAGTIARASDDPNDVPQAR